MFQVLIAATSTADQLASYETAGNTAETLDGVLNTRATSPAGCSTITSVKKSTLLTPFAFAYNLIFVLKSAINYFSYAILNPLNQDWADKCVPAVAVWYHQTDI